MFPLSLPSSRVLGYLLSDILTWDKKNGRKKNIHFTKMEINLSALQRNALLLLTLLWFIFQTNKISLQCIKK